MGLIPVEEFSEVINSSTNSQSETAAANASDHLPPRNTIHGWSRNSEIRPCIVRLVLTASLTILAVWLFSGWQTIHIAGMICVLGLLINAVAAYPLIIGADKPDLGSPRQALSAYFDSLEHHGPLYNRMWLLLTQEAKVCRSFNNFDGFRLYWKQKTNEWRHRAGAWTLTPVVIHIRDCKTVVDHSDSSNATISCQIDVLLRGRRAAGPVASYDFLTQLIKGCDGHWYLTSGDLPDALTRNYQAGLPSVPLANGQSAG